MNLKEMAQRREGFVSGHRLCSGCGAPAIVRHVFHATDYELIVANATGCLEVASTIYPYTSWNIPWIHSAFENAASTIAGVETMYKVLKKKGKIKKKLKFIAFGGDGGTYDIGFQALSGACERGHDFLYICYNNEAYMNTGIQRSGATPKGASTTTSPAGSRIPGKKQFPKDLTRIMAAHSIYVAQVSPAYPQDMVFKIKKGIEVDSPAFINAISPCPRGWRSDTSLSIELARLAVTTCFWPLYEVEDGKYKLTSESRKIAKGIGKKVPIEEYLKLQGRFSHLFREENKHIIEEIQERIDRDWKNLMEISEF